MTGTPLAKFATVTSRRVLVRLAEPADADDSYRWFADPIVTRFLPLAGEMELPLERIHAFLHQPPSDEVPVTIVHLPKTSIGCGGFRNFADGSAEVSIVLGEPSLWGLGLGAEALDLLILAASAQFHLDSLWLVVRVDNERALHLFRRFGFAQEGAPITGVTPLGNTVFKQRMRLPLSSRRSGADPAPVDP